MEESNTSLQDEYNKHKQADYSRQTENNNLAAELNCKIAALQSQLD